MSAVQIEHLEPAKLSRGDFSTEITEWDEQAYWSIVSTNLTKEQRARITTPPEVFPKQKEVVAVHWHPEFVPMDAIMERVDAMFPERDSELIIPTQHNELLELNGYAGVEIDCYSLGFNRKVQLLVHFSADKVRDASVLRSMLDHTFKYRATQLFEFIDSVIEPRLERRMQRAAAVTGASADLVRFVRCYVDKLKRMIDKHESNTPRDMLKNKIIRNYFNMLRDHFDPGTIEHAQVLLQTVKNIVKSEFSLTYFYRTMEIIEEVRALGGGIVVPHPEQFWPILLADYDIDGIEVWNPQSQEYTDFLINVVGRQNKSRSRGQRPILVFMGDDTHFGEKVIDPKYQNPDKAGRELGVQPAWDDLSIRKSLICASADRRGLIEEYKDRLG